jgi:polyhydroxyalkanoate synthase
MAKREAARRILKALPEARRLGPRPLPMNLATAVLTWTSCSAALPLSRTGSLSWRPELAARAKALAPELEKADPDALSGAVQAEARRRLAAFISGIQAYRSHPYRRRLSEPAEVWRAGSTRLLDYAPFVKRPRGSPKAGPVPLLVVPSLINRAYILDLSARASFLRWLAARGFRPFLVDWGRPGAEERGFSLTDYVAGRLEAALDRVIQAGEGPPILVGYCMGGMLALALALRRSRDLAGLALLATPWDFHAEQAELARRAALASVTFAPVIETLGELPTDVVQALFASLDPLMAIRKFAAFARLDPASDRAEAFVALEDWLNDGVPLAAPVARECLGGWYGGNTAHEGGWRIGGQPVDPARLTLPSLCVIPDHDRIVPPASALALATALEGATVLNPTLGHVGMMASARAERQAWTPILAWLRVTAAERR